MAKKRKPTGFQSEHIHIGSLKVENPYWSRDHDGSLPQTRYIGAAANLRESAIVALKAKGAIDDGQHKAAEKFCRLFEAVGGTGARAIDYSREHVDGGGAAQSIGDNQIEAGRQLKLAYEALTERYGVYAWKLVGYVCGEGLSIHELTETRRQRDTMTDNLRAYLDALAEHWNLSTGQKGTAPKRSFQGLTSRA